MAYPKGNKELVEKTVMWVPQYTIQTPRYRMLDNKDNHQNNKKDNNKNEKKVYEVN